MYQSDKSLVADEHLLLQTRRMLREHEERIQSQMPKNIEPITTGGKTEDQLKCVYVCVV